MSPTNATAPSIEHRTVPASPTKEKPVATKKKSPGTRLEEMPNHKGVRQLANGKWYATEGIGDLRQQRSSFRTEKEAVAWKQAAHAHHLAHEEKLPDAMWARMWEAMVNPAPTISPVVIGVPALVPTTVGAMVAAATEVRLAETRRKNTRTTIEGRSKVLLRFLKEKGLLDELVHEFLPAVADEFAVWVSTEGKVTRDLDSDGERVRTGYGRRYAGDLVRHAERIWDKAIRARNTTENPFVGVRANGEPVLREARSWSETELVAISHLLRPVYRLAFWLYIVTGMRRSEAMGLQLHRWDSTTRELLVEVQRQASPAKGTEEVKTPASYRRVPVCATFAMLLDAYIEHKHGVAPEEPSALAAWKERYIFVGVMGGAMNPQSMCDAVSNACRALGFDAKVRGHFDPLHGLRKVLAARADNATLGVSGRAISTLLGHAAATALGPNAASSTTLKSYTLELEGDLENLAICIEDWVQRQVMPLVEGDILGSAGIEDPVDLSAAAHMLSAGGDLHVVDDVHTLIQQGTLRSERVSFTGPIANRALRVSSSEVTAIVAARISADATTYSASEVADLLETDNPGVYRRVAAGDLTEVTDDPRRRIGARGHRTGSLPGGGRRFPKDEVDALVEAESEAIYRRRHWWTTGQAAAMTPFSESTLLRRADDGDILCWRDPGSGHNVRRLDPASVAAFCLREETVSVEEAARTLGCPRKAVTALLKVGRLTAGPRKSQILKCTVAEELERQRSAV